MMTIKEFICLIVIAAGMLWIHNAEADDWRDEDTAREIAYQALVVIDYAQTRYISKHCDRYRELNQLLGRCPNSGDITKYFLLLGLSHYGASRWLSQEYRATWQNVSVVWHAHVITRNAGLGIRLEW